MKTIRKFLYLAICAVLTVAICSFAPPAQYFANANSAQSHWRGVSAVGTLITGESCPLQVQSEVLTIDLAEFPQNYYPDAADYLAYNGRVTANYVFHNPASYRVDATLLFPFGGYPDYAPTGGGSFEEETGEYEWDDLSSYSVTVNDSALTTLLRHSFLEYGEQFSTDKDMGRLSDTYVTDSFFSPATPVTKYVFDVSGIDSSYKSAYASLQLKGNDNGARYLMVGGNGYHTQKNGKVSIGKFTENGSSIELYRIGTPQSVTNWTVYENGGEKKEIDATITLTDSEESTFLQLAMRYYNSEGEVSQIDWYNAVVASLNENKYGLFLGDLDRLKVTHKLMRWYQYDLSVEGGQSVSNSVSAPFYPQINLTYSPPLYGYTYLLSPAATWASFGSLTINVNTPYYLLDNEDGFTKTETGYTLTRQGLPEGELTFSLCTSEAPQKIYYGRSGQSLVKSIIGIVACSICLVAGIVGIIVFAQKKRKQY